MSLASLSNERTARTTPAAVPIRPRRPLRDTLLAIDRWLGRRSTAMAVGLLTLFATTTSALLSLSLYWVLYGRPPSGMFLVNPVVSTAVAAPIVYYAQLIIRTLSHAKRELGGLTEQLATAYDMAESANRAKSAFLANMSHELRTPLNAIIGFSEVLRDEVLGSHAVPKYAEYAHDINASGTHLLGIINDILDLSKIEAGKLDMKEEIVDLHGVLADVKRMLTPLAAQQKIELVFPDPRARLPHLWGSQRLIYQILLNVLSNGIKFTPPGGQVMVSMDCRLTQELVIDVADTGIGMSEGDIAKALAPFGQVDSSLSRKYEGTGLGLPLTKAMLEQHGGKMVIASMPGAGTRVSLEFPADRVVAPQMYDDSSVRLVAPAR